MSKNGLCVCGLIDGHPGQRQCGGCWTFVCACCQTHTSLTPSTEAMRCAGCGQRVTREEAIARATMPGPSDTGCVVPGSDVRNGLGRTMSQQQLHDRYQRPVEYIDDVVAERDMLKDTNRRLGAELAAKRETFSGLLADHRGYAAHLEQRCAELYEEQRWLTRELRRHDPKLVAAHERNRAVGPATNRSKS